MAVKIFVGFDDQQIQRELDKMKASWEKNEKAADEFGKAATKAESAVIRYGKSVVKQNRDAEQALKDRVKAVQQAAQAGEISAEEERRTVQRLIGKHREAMRAEEEAARKSTQTYKEKAQQIDQGKRKVEQLRKANQTLDQQYDKMRQSIKAAFQAGEISADEYRQSLKDLDNEQKKVSKSQGKISSDGAIAKIGKLAGAIALVEKAWNRAREAHDKYREIEDMAKSEAEKLEERRQSIRSLGGNVEVMQRSADEIATDPRIGITRSQALELEFESQSLGFDAREVARFDPAYPIATGKLIAGKFRTQFAGENLSVEEAFDTVGSAAAKSAMTAPELMKQLQIASQGARAIGASSSDVAAIASVVAGLSGEKTGTEMAGFASQAKLLIEQNPAFAKAFKGKDMVGMLEVLQADDDLRKGFIGNNKELLKATTTMLGVLPQIQERDAFIENAQRPEVRFAREAVEIAMDPTTTYGRINQSRRKAAASKNKYLVANEIVYAADAYERDSMKDQLRAEAIGRGGRYQLNLDDQFWLSDMLGRNSPEELQYSRDFLEPFRAVQRGREGEQRAMENARATLAKLDEMVLELKAQTSLTAKQAENLQMLQEQRTALSRAGEDR